MIGLQVSQSRSVLVTSRDLREQFVGRRSEIKVNFTHKLLSALNPCSFLVVFIRIDFQFSFEKYSYFVMGIITFGNFDLKRGFKINHWKKKVFLNINYFYIKPQPILLLNKCLLNKKTGWLKTIDGKPSVTVNLLTVEGMCCFCCGEKLLNYCKVYFHNLYTVYVHRFSSCPFMKVSIPYSFYMSQKPV